MASEQRLINANDLWTDVMMLPHNGDTISSEEVEQAIKEAPTVDAVEGVHGEWEKQQGIYSCSICGKACPYDVQADIIQYWPCNYCPSCGAKMDSNSDVPREN